MARPTFPGRICAPKKMIRLSSQSVTRARAKRLSRNRPIGTPLRPATTLGGRRCLLADEPRLSEVQVSHGARLDARDVASRGRQEVIEVREDDRRLIDEKLLDLPGRRLLRLQV